jgi:CheY-like chemotaxis protein
MVTRSALVVDDSKSARFALRRYLENRHYRVEAVESAAEAISFLRQHRPGVIFLDHIMPGTDGFEALRAIKSDERVADIPVVICSSNEGVEFNAFARSVGATDVLPKPPNPEHLTRILDGLNPFSFTPAVTSTQEIDQSRFDLVDAATVPDKIPQAEARWADRIVDLYELTADPMPESSSSLPPRVQLSTGLLTEQIEHLREAVDTLRAQMEQARVPSAVEIDAGAATEGLGRRLDQMHAEWVAQLAAVHARLDKLAQSQAEQFERMLDALRRSTVEESRIVAERAAKAAVSKLVEQFSQALAGTFSS